MTERSDETSTGTAGDASDVTGSGTEGDAIPFGVAPAAMGSGSATPIAAPAALAEQSDAPGPGGERRPDPDQEAFNSGEDEVGGSGGPAGGTARP